VQLESDSHNTLSSAKLAVIVTKTMDACITDNCESESLIFCNWTLFELNTVNAEMLHYVLLWAKFLASYKWKGINS
jgi:hypothetical protein